MVNICTKSRVPATRPGHPLPLLPFGKAHPKRQGPHPSGQTKTPRPRTACRGSRGVATKIPPRGSPLGMGEWVGPTKKLPRFPPISAAAPGAKKKPPTKGRGLTFQMSFVPLLPASTRKYLDPPKRKVRSSSPITLAKSDSLHIAHNQLSTTRGQSPKLDCPAQEDDPNRNK